MIYTSTYPHCEALLWIPARRTLCSTRTLPSPWSPRGMRRPPWVVALISIWWSSNDNMISIYDNMIITPINTMRVVFSFNFVFLSQSKQNNQLIQDYKDLPCEAEEKKGRCGHHCQMFICFPVWWRWQWLSFPQKIPIWGLIRESASLPRCLFPRGGLKRLQFLALR